MMPRGMLLHPVPIARVVTARPIRNRLMAGLLVDFRRELSWYRKNPGPPEAIRGVSYSGVFYPKSRRADCGWAFAWANMAVPDCTNMLYRANWVLSSATSTSLMRLLAAERFVFCTAIWSRV